MQSHQGEIMGDTATIFILSSSNDSDYYGCQQMNSTHLTLLDAKRYADASRKYGDQYDTIEQWPISGFDYLKYWTLITRSVDGVTYWSDEAEPPGMDRPPRNDREILRLDAWIRAMNGELIEWIDETSYLTSRACAKCNANGGVWCNEHAATARKILAPR